MVPRLLFRLYESGLNNDLMSLELAVGLAWITRRHLILYGSRDSDHRILPSRGGRFDFVPPSRRHLIDQRCRPTVLDLIGALPVPFTQADADSNRCVESVIAKIGESPDLHEAAFVAKPIPRDDPRRERFGAFAEGRPELTDPGNEVWHLGGRTLGYYSRFFFDPPSGFHRLMERIDAAAPYREFAKRVAGSLGEFSALHVRLTDFRRFQPRVERDYRDEILESARALIEPESLLVIATDESENRDFFSGILQAFPHHVFLDDWIVREFGSEFRELPFVDETAFGLVNRLVLEYANEFAGTPGSSFTGMVHRARLRRALSGCGSARLAGEQARFHFISSGFDDPAVAFERGAYLETCDGPFSWNRIALPVPGATKSWYREWPEAVVPVI